MCAHVTMGLPVIVTPACCITGGEGATISSICFCLCSGANSTAKNVDGKTAKDVAELNSQTDVVERFDNYKAAA